MLEFFNVRINDKNLLKLDFLLNLNIFIKNCIITVLTKSDKRTQPKIF